jgi:tRNA A37 threonylcarbamoyladenosine synthetase subunit TsaC/SUA5/YrdC
MRTREAEILAVKRLKKDGDLGDEIVERVVAALGNGAVAMLPVDNVYYFVGRSSGDIGKAVPGKKHGAGEVVTLISSYKMLNDIAEYSKSYYDFLNRIWPGEVTVILKDLAHGNGRTVQIRYPRNRFLLNVIDRLDMPVYGTAAATAEKETVYRKRDLVSLFRGTVDLIVIVDELCKKHPHASLIDISGEALMIVRAGKVSAEELKSLYFLGKADG